MSSNALKILALILMVIDHIGEFLPGMPIWLRWLGRISAPLFFFCMVWGFCYTHNRKLYLTRMYGFGVAMGIIGFICNNMVEEKTAAVTNNIFVTLLLVGVIIWLTEAKSKGYWAGFIVFQGLAFVICGLVGRLLPYENITDLACAIFPSMLLCEGSFVFVVLGVVMYKFRYYRDITVGYGIFCGAYGFFSLIAAATYSSLMDMSITEILLYYDFQWMMVAALPFMRLYNGEKGKSMKYFFYIFYPAHIVILFFVGNYMAGNL